MPNKGKYAIHGSSQYEDITICHAAKYANKMFMCGGQLTLLYYLHIKYGPRILFICSIESTYLFLHSDGDMYNMH